MSEHDEAGHEGDEAAPADEPTLPGTSSPWATSGPSSPWATPPGPSTPAGSTTPADVPEPPTAPTPTTPIPVSAPGPAAATPPGAVPPADAPSGAWAAAAGAGAAGSGAPPGTPWSAPAPPTGGWGGPPASPAPAGGDRGGLRHLLLGALVGAIVAALVASGMFLAFDDDHSGPNTTVAAARNTSVFTKPADVHAVLEKVEPAVVAITTGSAAGDGLFGSGSGGGGGAGTGVVISRDGYIVTNNHVVDGSGGRVEVTFNDGTHQRATVVGTDPSADLAVVKVGTSNLTAAALGDSDKLVVGDEVVAIGNALALPGQPSVTRGIVSALNRSIDTEVGSTLDHMIQTDAAINPGNSGGPLVNSNGEVVGINTAIANPAEAQNVGFAIAINQAKPIIDELRQGRSVQPAYLGVVTQSVTPAIQRQLDLKVSSGAVVQRVESSSPADSAGIRQGDVIVKVGDKDVKSAQDVGAAVRSHRPGDKVTIVVNRDGANRSLDVTLGSRPENLG